LTFNRWLCSTLAATLALGSCGNGSSPGVEPNSPDAPPIAAGELRALVSDADVRRFYEGRNWRPVWNAARAQQLVEILPDARRHGIDPGERLQQMREAAGAEREVAMTRAALWLAEALAQGQVDPRSIRDIYTLPTNSIDAAAELAAAAERDSIGPWLRSLPPSDDEYRALSDAYLRTRDRPASELAVAPGEALQPGQRDPRIPQIEQILLNRGYLATPSGADRDDIHYRPALVDAIRAMQRDHGIAVDGIVGEDTRRVLNKGPRDRARQLAVNLERRRWLRRSPPATRIRVNAAAAILDFWRDGAHVDRRKVIVGQADWATPQLASPIYRLVANPTWTVPKSIEEADIEPRGPAYLQRNNMVRRDGWIVQLPGPGNALGRVKFDMRNAHAIYLHDTPSKPLFERQQRHFSHGCVRVDGALEFARMLAEQDGKLEEFEAALASGEERFVPLGEQILVRIVYHTVIVEDGRIAFRPDVYGWDREVARSLGLGEGPDEISASRPGDVGP
jgi:murein L,D-transpeptidase YcbB/YkuD